MLKIFGKFTALGLRYVLLRCSKICSMMTPTRCNAATCYRVTRKHIDTKHASWELYVSSTNRSLFGGISVDVWLAPKQRVVLSAGKTTGETMMMIMLAGGVTRGENDEHADCRHGVRGRGWGVGVAQTSQTI